MKTHRGLARHIGGFTLIELLVVIAIIGLLSSIVFASLSTARVKGRVAAVQGSMHSAQTAALLCMDDGTALNAPVAGALVCVGSLSKYAALPATGSWVYSTAAQSDLITNDGAFSFYATATGGDAKTVTCSESGCVTS